MRLFILGSPVGVTKAITNPTEGQSICEGSIRDGVARICHLVWLAAQINNDTFINETGAAEKPEGFQSEEALFQSLSFGSISAFGPNAAAIHYSPKTQTAAQITKNGVYLLDAVFPYETYGRSIYILA